MDGMWVLFGRVVCVCVAGVVVVCVGVAVVCMCACVLLPVCGVPRCVVFCVVCGGVCCSCVVCCGGCVLRCASCLFGFVCGASVCALFPFARPCSCWSRLGMRSRSDLLQHAPSINVRRQTLASQASVVAHPPAWRRSAPLVSRAPRRSDCAHCPKPVLLARVGMCSTRRPVPRRSPQLRLRARTQRRLLSRRPKQRASRAPRGQESRSSKRDLQESLASSAAKRCLAKTAADWATLVRARTSTSGASRHTRSDSE